MENRRLKVMLVVLVAALVGFAAVNVFGGKGNGSSLAASEPASPSTTAKSATKSTPSTTTPFQTETFDVFATRDPFEPVIQAPPPTTVAPTTPGLTDPNAGTPTTTAPSTGGLPLTESAPTQHVSVLDVFVDQDAVTRARVVVGLTQYTVQTGQTFATSFRVVSLDEPSGCGQFLYGDSPFQLCEGESASK